MHSSSSAASSRYLLYLNSFQSTILSMLVVGILNVSVNIFYILFLYRLWVFFLVCVVYPLGVHARSMYLEYVVHWDFLEWNIIQTYYIEERSICEYCTEVSPEKIMGTITQTLYAEKSTIYMTAGHLYIIQHYIIHIPTFTPNTTSN